LTIGRKAEAPSAEFAQKCSVAPNECDQLRQRLDQRIFIHLRIL
jgi:hypothetical protein